MRSPRRLGLIALWLVFAAAVHAATPQPPIVALGHQTFSITREADTGFTRSTEKLKAQALKDAAAYCATLHKEMKVLEVTTHHPLVPLTGFAKAKVVFQALDTGDPALHAPATATAGVTESGMPPGISGPATPVDALYYGLLKLDDLRKRGLLSEEEFQSQRRALIEKSK